MQGSPAFMVPASPNSLMIALVPLPQRATHLRLAPSGLMQTMILRLAESRFLWRMWVPFPVRSEKTSQLVQARSSGALTAKSRAAKQAAKRTKRFMQTILID